MNYGQIYTVDIANGIGCRTSLFVSGCTHQCNGCFNQETWDFQYGKPYTQAIEDYLVDTLQPDYISGLSILGGEPMELSNQEAIIPLIRRVNEMVGKTVWIYSGYTWEELMDPENKRCHGTYTNEILQKTDVLVDGEFHLSERDISLRFRGSANQRVIDVPASLKAGTVILSEYMFKDR